MSWLSTLEAAQADLTAALAAATLPAELEAAQVVIDPRHLRAPAVYVKLRALTGTLEGNYAEVTVFVMVPDGDFDVVITALEALSGPVVATVPPMTTPTLVALPLPRGGTPAPALRYDHQLIIE
jgi:hypothetical protein